MSSSDGWSPDVYARFAKDRSAPFDDLLAMLAPSVGGTLLDLGCGTGALTSKAHAALQTVSALGLDNSPAMLNASAAPGVRLERRDIVGELPGDRFDRVISNSALNWVPDHAAYVPRVLSLVAPGGQLAVQMPSNPGTPFSDCAMHVAARFSRELDGFVYRSPVQPPEFYAELLARGSCAARSVRGGIRNCKPAPTASQSSRRAACCRRIARDSRRTTSRASSTSTAQRCGVFSATGRCSSRFAGCSSSRSSDYSVTTLSALHVRPSGPAAPVEQNALRSAGLRVVSN